MAKSKAAAKRQKQNERGAILGIIGIVAVIFVIIIVVVVNQNKQASVTVTAGKYAGIPQATTTDGAPVLGSSTAKVTIMEFADFSCPHCAEYRPVMDQLIEQLVKPGKVRVIFRPETFVGGQFSEVAAEAALCAGKQGAFWEMHDALFALQTTNGLRAFTIQQMQSLGNSLNLDGNAIAQCIANNDTKPILDSSYQLGQTYDVQGTPSVLYSTDGANFQWFVNPNGEQQRGGVPIDYVYLLLQQVGS